MARETSASVRLLHALNEMAYLDGMAPDGTWSGDLAGMAREGGAKVLADATAIARSAGVEPSQALLEEPASAWVKPSPTPPSSGAPTSWWSAPTAGAAWGVCCWAAAPSRSCGWRLCLCWWFVVPRRTAIPRQARPAWTAAAPSRHPRQRTVPPA